MEKEGTFFSMVEIPVSEYRYLCEARKQLELLRKLIGLEDNKYGEYTVLRTAAGLEEEEEEC